MNMIKIIDEILKELIKVMKTKKIHPCLQRDFQASLGYARFCFFKMCRGKNLLYMNVHDTISFQ